MPVVPCSIEPKVARIGEVKPNSTTQAVFTLKNTGATPLVVKSVKPSCKCTGISDIVGQTIAPGATLQLKASLKAPPVPGPKDAKVFIDFENVPGVAIAMLEGEVVMPILAAPPFVDALNSVTSGATKVRSADGKPFKVVTAGGAAPVFVGFDPAKDAPRSEYELRWNLPAGATPPVWWAVETDRADCPVIPLRVRHDQTGARWDMERFQREWILKDQIALGGLMEPGKPVELVMELEHYNPRGKGAVVNNAWSQVKGIQTGTPALAAEIVDAKVVGDVVELKVRLTPTAAASGLIATTMNVSTATGSGPVPFFARVQAPSTPAPTKQ